MVEGTPFHEQKDPRNVVRGYQAALHNPNVSQEAKESVKNKMEEIKSQGMPQEQGQAQQRSGPRKSRNSQRQTQANEAVVREDEEEEPEFVEGEEQEVYEEEEADREIAEEGWP
ncbi:hypothetical protein Unana1_02578 [Umbelopsis nana]